MTYRIKQYGLEQGALEIQYMEEFFGEFPGRKTATEIVRRLDGREHLILMAEAPLPDDPAMIVPVAYRVSHELRSSEPDPQLTDLVARLAGHVRFDVVKYEPHAGDNGESKVYLSKRLGADVLRDHQSRRSVVRIG